MHSSKMRTGRSLPYGGGGYRLLYTVGGSLSGAGGSLRETPSPVDRQTPVKILPFPKLRLRVVNILDAVATG